MPHCLFLGRDNPWSPRLANFPSDISGALVARGLQWYVCSLTLIEGNLAVEVSTLLITMCIALFPVKVDKPGQKLHDLYQLESHDTNFGIRADCIKSADSCANGLAALNSNKGTKEVNVVKCLMKGVTQ